MNILTENGTEAQISSSLQTPSSRQTITPPHNTTSWGKGFLASVLVSTGPQSHPMFLHRCLAVLGGDPLPTATVDVLHYSLSPKPLSSHLRFVLSGVQDVSTWKSLPGEPFAVSRNWVTLGGS